MTNEHKVFGAQEATPDGSYYLRQLVVFPALRSEPPTSPTHRRSLNDWNLFFNSVAE